MEPYKHLLSTIARNIKYLNKQLEEFYHFEESVGVVGGSLDNESIKAIRKLEHDIAMFSGLADFHNIQFDEETVPLSGDLKID
jgi:hypothetical protein